MRQIDFSDGYETAAAPDQGVIATGGFGAYSSDAAFVTALTIAGGTLANGNAYFNTVDKRIHFYDGATWIVSTAKIDSVLFLGQYASDGAYVTALTTAGGTLAQGAHYWNTVNKTHKLYDGTTWHEALQIDLQQTITNKDYDGGNASNSRRLTLPKGTFAAVNALTKKAGNLYYVSDGGGSIYFDNGTSLSAVLGAAVDSVNGYGGTVVLVTDDIAEDGSPVNLWFTDARAKAAAVQDAIVDAVTDIAPSQNAVFDALALKEDLSNKGIAGGYAELDGTGKVPVAQLPDTIVGAVDYQGVWNALTNSPDLGASTPTKGDYFVVGTAGTGASLGGFTDWEVNDWAIYNGSAWEKVDNTDQVLSVNGFQGAVSLDTDDIPEGTNEYYTAAKAKADAVDDAIVDGVTDVAPSQNAVFDALAGKQDTGNYITDLNGDVVANGPGAVTATIQANAIDNNKVSPTAGIARSKLASGNNYRVAVNDNAGVLSDAAAITGNRAVISDANGIPTHSATTDSEIGHVSGVTSPLQTQINGKQATLPLTTQGDLLYYDAGYQRRAIASSEGMALKRVGGLPAWEIVNDMANETRMWEDWIGDGTGVLRWLDSDTLTGVSQTSLTVQSNAHPGVLELATGTTNGAIAARTLLGVTTGTGTSGLQIGNGELTLEWLVNIPTLATVTDDYRIDLGLAMNHGLTVAQIKLQYNRSGSVNWRGVTTSASVSSTQDTGFAVATGWTKLKTVVNAAGTSVEFFINGVSGGSLSTNVPLSTENLAPHCRIIKASASVVSSICYLDYFRLYQRFTTTRG